MILLLAVNLAACSTMQPVRVDDLARQQAPAEVQQGDRVEVITREREKFEFTVTQINEVGLGGKFGFIPYERISRLSVHRPGSASADDFYWLWAAAGIALFIVLIANADSVTACSPGPCPSN